MAEEHKDSHHSHGEEHDKPHHSTHDEEHNKPHNPTPHHTTHHKKDSSPSLGKLFAVVFVAALVGAFVGGGPLANLAGGGPIITPTPTTSTPTAPSPTPTAPSPSPTVNLADLADDDPYLGSENAPVTIVEFSDGQCPFCRRHYTQTLPQIITDYVDTGKVKYVYRDFPLSFHPAAQPAAEAGECADEQGKFWEMHDKLFDEQNKQGQGTIQFSVDDIKTWAAEIGLDTQSFNSCLDSGKYRSEVQADFAAGQSAGVLGTPTFFIGKSDGQGARLVGAQPYSTIKAAIEAALA